MRALVGLKRVIDYTVKVRVKPDHTGVIKENIKHSCNPFDEIAVEQAVRMKEKGIIKEITAVSIGGPKAVEVLRGSALALGVDKAIHVKLPDDNVDVEPLVVAKVFKALAAKVQPDLIFLGKLAIDGDNCQTPQMLSALLDWPQALFACNVEVSPDGKWLHITREVDSGLQEIKVAVPAVVSCDLRLNQPRYAKLPDIMKAKKKPLEEITIASLGIDVDPRIQIVDISDPPQRKGGVKVKTIEELVEKLTEAKVI
eukprot:TRINITY_DN939_c0_g1_i1.p1 TRINITY_DN939_c0_g1~~TRINITY_DN939_c0_g1_i1.p1  ORF type:complete len:281 (+),score=58.03 TRINITY_DN939_c0_g1_i1:80-844(+)